MSDEVENFNQELGEYKQKAEEYLNAWKRMAADFANYKKRREKEDRELANFAQEITIVKILPILESLEQALKHSPNDEKYRMWSEGVVKIVQQLEKVLLEMGVEKIESVGQKFDPTLHEALDHLESDHPPGTIIEEIQSGYKLNDKVIRPSKVKVAKGKDK